MIDCVRHGTQGFGFVCIHIAEAIDSGAQVGFFWLPDPEMARPFAWCLKCEEFLNQNGGDLVKLSKLASFKFFCAMCWDEAKAALYDRSRE